MIQQIGPKKAREMWFTARFYTASEAEKMGLVNIVVPVSSFYFCFFQSIKSSPSLTDTFRLFGVMYVIFIDLIFTPRALVFTWSHEPGCCLRTKLA